jgi:hypothetical protein
MEKTWEDTMFYISPAVGPKEYAKLLKVITEKGGEIVPIDRGEKCVIILRQFYGVVFR